MIGSRLIKKSPNDDRRVIDASTDHRLHHGGMFVAEIFVAKLPLALPPANPLFPNKNPHFIAEIEKPLILRIVAATNKISS
jgi:hypothetical protein